MRRLIMLLTSLALAAPLAVAGAAPKSLATIIANAVADPARPADERKGDALRKPAETLAFSGVRPGMIVGEFYPGGGYFTRLLSAVVGPSGHVYGLENSGWKSSAEADRKLAASAPLRNVSIDVQSFGTVAFPRPLDLAWITQNYHDLKIAEYGKIDTIAFDRAVYAALKPGGTYFILDHQGLPGMSEADIARTHRIDRAVVIREVTSVGFKLVQQGEFLHRPADDHKKPIFDESIRGHTDQYALKFVKPRR